MRHIHYSRVAGIVFLLLLSCSTIRQKDKRAKNTVRYQEEDTRWRSTFLSFVSDSTFEHWYFFSDTAFTYHPDSGLQARSGTLWHQNTRVIHQGTQQTADSSHRTQYHEELREKGSHTIRYPDYTVWIWTIILAAIAYMINKTRSRKV